MWYSYSGLTTKNIVFGNSLWITSQKVYHPELDMIYKSSDVSNLNNWISTYQSSSTTCNFKSNKSCYGDIGFLIGGESNSPYSSFYMYSSDGSTWNGSVLTTGTTTMGIESVCFGDGNYLIVDNTYNYGRVHYSTDLINWTNILNYGRSGSINYLRDCAYGNNNYVAVGHDCVFTLTGLTSTGNTEWIYNPLTTNLPKITFGDNIFLILNSNINPNIYYSIDDGINWTSGYTSDLEKTVTALNYVDNYFYACVQTTGNTFEIKKSSDGLSWTTESVDYDIPNIFEFNSSNTYISGIGLSGNTSRIFYQSL